VPPINSGGVNWRRNLAALWFAEFTAIFGFSFAFPFLPIFLSRDLGVHQGSDLYLWTAASASVSGLSMAIASPIWGILGDRFGRKPMLMRSMLGGAITVGLIVRESPLPPRLGPRVSTLATIRQQQGLVRALAVLIGAQGLVSVCNSATQPLIVLRLLEMITHGVSAVTGIAFGLAGLASSI